MTTLCSFVKFADLDHALTFAVMNATPEREDDVIGQLPNGVLVHGVTVDDDDRDGDFWLTTDVERLLDDVDAHEGRKALDAAPDWRDCI